MKSILSRKRIRQIKSFWLLPKRATSACRILPDFLLIGAQRSGTTSLYNYIIDHPRILPSCWKEVHFFDINYSKGVNWYRAHFPTDIYRTALRVAIGGECYTGESSPYYLFHPHAAKRASTIVPDAKVIVLLRNPVDRAYSHYQREVRLGFETLPFEEAIARERQRLRNEVTRMLQDENYVSPLHYRAAYLARGIYVQHLQTWNKFFPVEQLLILDSKEFFTQPRVVISKVIRFLGIPDWTLDGNLRTYSQGEYSNLDQGLRDRLVEFYVPHNRQLFEFLGRTFDWC